MNNRRILLILCNCIGFVNIYLLWNHQKIDVPSPNDNPPIVKPDEQEKPKPKPEPPKPKVIEPDYITVPKVSDRVQGDTIYADIMNHAKKPIFGYSESTNAHETTHMINSEIRNSNSIEGKKVNGFYVIDGKGVVIAEPKTRKRDVIPYLPSPLRSYRFGTYITGQTAWDDTPLYICDEWVSYVNGSMVNVQQVQNGTYKGGWTDGVSGCLDFSIYSIALAMSIAKGDPDYWNGNTQFKNFLIWQLKRARDTYNTGSKLKEFTWERQDSLLNNLRTSPEAEEMRKFIKTNLEGVWLEEGPVQTHYIDWHKNHEFQLEFVPPFSEED